MSNARTLPVLIHHETGEKPQTGGGRNQEYVKYCIQHTKKYNSKVILLGDEYNKEWCDEWYHVNDFVNDKWKQFQQVFVNWSTYPDAWALGIFKRFYLIEEYLRRNHYEECVIMDSDVLVYLNFLEYTPFLSCSAALEICGQQDISSLPEGNGLRMCAIAGVAYFTLDALSHFNNFCIDVYQNHRDLLLPKKEAHITYGLAGGICEMTLLYLWTQAYKEGTILNLMEERDGFVFNGPIGTTENLFPEEFQVSPVTQVKRFRFRNGIPYFFTMDSKRPVATYSLHFGGADKIYLKSISLHNRIHLTALAERWYWILRGELRFLKKWIPGKK